jgi:ABC-type antimicrobial peptide transport system permease subunit
MPENLSNRLGNLSGVANTEERLVTQAHITEVRSYVIDPETLATIPIGDSRERDSLIIGVEPDKVLSQWFVDGRFLDENDSFKATVGDSLAQALFSRPLDQSMSFSNGTYDIVGVCVEPINNGFVAYVPLKVLLSASSIPVSNTMMVRIDPSADEAVVVNKIRSELASENEAFDVLELDEILEISVAFVGHLWSAIMLLPLFSLISASLCMTAYVMLAVTEQKQEFGMLRALGTRPSAIVRLVSLQNLVVLLSSYGVGLALGIMTTLMILIPDPIVTSLTIAEICGWLLAASASIFIMSLYPAMKAARASILQCIT